MTGENKIIKKRKKSISYAQFKKDIAAGRKVCVLNLTLDDYDDRGMDCASNVKILVSRYLPDIPHGQLQQFFELTESAIAGIKKKYARLF